MELAPPSRSQTVELRLAFVVRFPPLAGDPTLMFQSIERWIQRALLDLQLFARDLLNAQQNPVAVQRAKRDRFEDQHVQCALQQINRFAHVSPCVSRRDLNRTLLVGQGESILAGQLAANHLDDALQCLRAAINRGYKDADGLMADLIWRSSARTQTSSNSSPNSKLGNTPGIIASGVQRAAHAIITPTDGPHPWRETWSLRNPVPAGCGWHGRGL